MSLVVPFDDIPAEHLLGRFLRYPLISELRKELEDAKRKAEQAISFLMFQNLNIDNYFNLRMHGCEIHYMRKSNTPGRQEDDVFYITPIDHSIILGKIRIRGGLIGHSPIKPHEVEFKFEDLREDNWFTVGPSRRKQQLNFNRGVAATMAAIRPDMANRVGLSRSVDPYTAAAYIAPMLGASINADVEDERMRREANVATAATAAAAAPPGAMPGGTTASLPEPGSHWSNNVHLNFALRKSRKRTRTRRTRRTRRH